MVGKLARWLRVLGVDVLYHRRWDDLELLSLCRREERGLLTRDVPLTTRATDITVLLVESGDFREQLTQVVAAFGLDTRGRRFTRCLECNSLLEPVERHRVAGRVPPYVYDTQARFKHCPRCSRYLWSGTHREHMERTLDSIFHTFHREPPT
jgi:hypothetical protein